MAKNKSDVVVFWINSNSCAWSFGNVVACAYSSDMKRQMKIPISERAAIGRINRSLAREGECLHKARVPVSIWTTPVNYYVVRLQQNAIVTEVHDLEDFARQCEVLKPWETIAG
jgi:hypothetical protein